MDDYNPYENTLGWITVLGLGGGILLALVGWSSMQNDPAAGVVVLVVGACLFAVGFSTLLFWLLAGAITTAIAPRQCRKPEPTPLVKLEDRP